MHFFLEVGLIGHLSVMVFSKWASMGGVYVIGLPELSTGFCGSPRAAGGLTARKLAWPASRRTSSAIPECAGSPRWLPPLSDILLGRQVAACKSRHGPRGCLPWLVDDVRLSKHVDIQGSFRRRAIPTEPSNATSIDHIPLLGECELGPRLMPRRFNRGGGLPSSSLTRWVYPAHRRSSWDL